MLQSHHGWCECTLMTDFTQHVINRNRQARGCQRLLAHSFQNLLNRHALSYSVGQRLEKMSLFDVFFTVQHGSVASRSTRSDTSIISYLDRGNKQEQVNQHAIFFDSRCRECHRAG